MKGFPHLLFLVAMVGGCATAGSESALPTEPIAWPVGQYLLEGSVEYRRDTEWAVRTVWTDYRAELDILADGTMSLSSSSGPCRESPFGEVRQDRVPRQRTFSCNDVSYVLKPMVGTIRGEIRVWVIEAIRQQGLCRRRGLQNGLEVCAAYARVVREQPVDKMVRLSVVPKVPARASLEPPPPLSP